HLYLHSFPTRRSSDLYIVPSRSWSLTIPRELRVTGSTVLSDCTAVGFTSRGTEKWNLTLPEFALECVGIPPYPGDLYPRVIGIRSEEHTSELQSLAYL